MQRNLHNTGLRCIINCPRIGKKQKSRGDALRFSEMDGHMLRRLLFGLLAAALLFAAAGCTPAETPVSPEPTPAATPTPKPTPTPIVIPESPKPEVLPAEPPSLSQQKGYQLLPHSAWDKIVETCLILNPLAHPTKGSKLVYDLPGYDYDITLEEVLERGESGGFCCAGYITWLFYNILKNDVYADAVNGLQAPSSLYKSVRFYCKQNSGPLRKVDLADAQLGDLVVFGGVSSDHQHVGMYAGRDSAGNVLIWHCGQDGVGRMRADRVRTNGIYNYVAQIYSYFEPPADLNTVVWKGDRKISGEHFTVTGPWGYEGEVTSSSGGKLKLAGVDLGRYTLTDDRGNAYTVDVVEGGTNAIIVLK